MKPRARLLVLASSALLAIVPARRLAGQDDRAAAGHWSCFSGYEDNPIYVTPVWDGTATAEDVGSAFRQMLSTKYGYKGRVSCSRADMSGSTRAGLQAGMDQQFAQWQKNGKQVIRTGWTFASSSEATSADAPQPAANPGPEARDSGTAPSGAGKPTQYEVCRVVRGAGARIPGSKYTAYLSGVMLRALNEEDYSRAFAAFLAKKYGVPRGVSPECLASPSRAEAQKVIDVQWTDQPLMTTYVRTGWTYPSSRPAADTAKRP